MTLFFVILIIVFLCLIGYSIISICNFLPKSSFLEKLTFSYGLGVGLTTVQMFFYSLLGISWTRTVLVVPWIFVILFFLIKNRKGIIIKPSFTIPKDIIGKLFLLGIVITIGFVTFEALNRPLSAWDGWAKWYIGGKAFFLAHGIDASFIRYAKYSDPPLINLFLSFVFTLLGKVNDSATLLFFTGFYISLGGMLYSAVRKFFSQSASLLFTFLFFTIENFIRQGGRFDVGNADLPLSYFFFASVILVLNLKKNFSYRYIAFLNIFLFAGAFTKSEGVPFFLIIQAMLTVELFVHKKMQYIFASIVGIFPLLCWNVYAKTMHLLQYPFLSSSIQINRTLFLIKGTIKEFLNLQRWNILWPSFLLSIFVHKYTKSRLILLLIIILQLASYYYIYFVTTLDYQWHFNGSFDRLLLQVAPLAMYFIAFALSKKDKKLNKHSL